MAETNYAAVILHMSALIEKAKREEIMLEPSDFKVVEGEFLTIDGMDADEWVDAMTSE